MFLLMATAWAQEIRETVMPAPRFSLFKILWGADPVVKLTLLILAASSVASWAIILYKHRQIKSSRTLGRRFIDAFWRTRNLDELSVKAPGGHSPMGAIFRSTYKNIAGPKKNVEALKKQIERSTEWELEELERYVPFLATTGSYAPFVGLLGTVWGILIAFWKIGSAGASSLAVVGPHIAEALIATAVGLITAIPALIAYNFFVGRLRILNREITTFSEDLEERLQQELFPAK